MGRPRHGVRKSIFEVKMPELPEVQTIANQLERELAGKEIVGLVVHNAKSFVGKRSDVISQKIINITRRAKVLTIKLSNKKWLLIHLKMTGQLIYVNEEIRIAGGHPDHDWHANLPNNHTRLTFEFADGSELFFNDIRKFGWCKVMGEEEMSTYFEKYGPEPLPKINLEYLKEKAVKMNKSAIKRFLMDQGVIAGIGNIYADEILFASQVHPERTAGSITDTEWQKIALNTEDILSFAIEMGGTTDSDYVNAYGVRGGMQDHLKVYHRTGEPCLKKCGGAVERIIVGGRSTHFCPNCQKESVK